MHFFCACVLGDKNLCNNKYQAINQTDNTEPEEEQPQPQQVLRGNHLSSCEGGFTMCVCVCVSVTIQQGCTYNQFLFFFAFNSRIAATADTARLLRFLFLMNNLKKSKLLLYITEKTNHCFIKLHHNTLWLSWLGCANVLSYLVKGSIKLCRRPLICLICMSRIGTDLLLPVWKKKKKTLRKQLRQWVWMDVSQASQTPGLGPNSSPPVGAKRPTAMEVAAGQRHLWLNTKIFWYGWALQLEVLLKCLNNRPPTHPLFWTWMLQGCEISRRAPSRVGAAYHLLPPLRDLHLNTLSCVLTVIMLRSLDI